MFDKLKALFQTPSTSTTFARTSGEASVYDNLPSGFFIVETANGKQSLGYYDPQTKHHEWPVGTTVVVGGRRITLDPDANLPTVKLAFMREQPGVTRVSNRRLLDTDSMDWDGEVKWDGGKPNDGWV